MLRPNSWAVGLVFQTHSITFDSNGGNPFFSHSIDSQTNRIRLLRAKVDNTKTIWPIQAMILLPLEADKNKNSHLESKSWIFLIASANDDYPRFDPTWTFGPGKFKSLGSEWQTKPDFFFFEFHLYPIYIYFIYFINILSNLTEIKYLLSDAPPSGSQNSYSWRITIRNQVQSYKVMWCDVIDIRFWNSIFKPTRVITHKTGEGLMIVLEMSLRVSQAKLSRLASLTFRGPRISCVWANTSKRITFDLDRIMKVRRDQSITSITYMPQHFAIPIPRHNLFQHPIWTWILLNFELIVWCVCLSTQLSIHESKASWGGVPSKASHQNHLALILCG